MSRFRKLAVDSDSETGPSAGDDDGASVSPTALELRERRNDEVAAIQAIVDDDVTVQDDDDSDEVHLTFRVVVGLADSPWSCCAISFTLGKLYPDTPPAGITVRDWPASLPGTLAGTLRRTLEEMASNQRGQEQCLTLFEVARDYLSDKAPRPPSCVPAATSPTGSLLGKMEARLAFSAAQEAAEKALHESEDAAARRKNDDERVALMARINSDELRLDRERKLRSMTTTGPTRALLKEDGAGLKDGDRLLDYSSDEDAPPPGSTTSRFLCDYIEIKKLGQGGGGAVVMVKNRLDKHYYAIKIIHRAKSRKIMR